MHILDFHYLLIESQFTIVQDLVANSKPHLFLPATLSLLATQDTDLYTIYAQIHPCDLFSKLFWEVAIEIIDLAFTRLLKPTIKL